MLGALLGALLLVLVDGGLRFQSYSEMVGDEVGEAVVEVVEVCLICDVLSFGAVVLRGVGRDAAAMLVAART
jgi:hypothetical protein